MTMTQLATDRAYTAQEFLDLPDDGKNYELLKGELIEMAGPSFSHGRIINNLSRHLGNFLQTHPVGKDVSGTAFILDVDNAPRPDVAFVVTERLSGVNYDDAFPGPPDLAVEVVSRTDVVFNVDDKIEQDLANGVQLVWIINPRRKTVEVFHVGSLKPIVLASEEELDGEHLIPGFKLKIRELFE